MNNNRTVIYSLAPAGLNIDNDYWHESRIKSVYGDIAFICKTCNNPIFVKSSVYDKTEFHLASLPDQHKKPTTKFVFTMTCPNCKTFDSYDKWFSPKLSKTVAKLIEKGYNVIASNDGTHYKNYNRVHCYIVLEYNKDAVKYIFNKFPLPSPWQVVCKDSTNGTITINVPDLEPMICPGEKLYASYSSDHTNENREKCDTISIIEEWANQLPSYAEALVESYKDADNVLYEDDSDVLDENSDK